MVVAFTSSTRCARLPWVCGRTVGAVSAAPGRKPASSISRMSAKPKQQVSRQGVSQMADTSGVLSDRCRRGKTSGFRAVLSDVLYVPLSRVDAASRLGISKRSATGQTTRIARACCGVNPGFGSPPTITIHGSSTRNSRQIGRKISRCERASAPRFTFTAVPSVHSQPSRPFSGPWRGRRGSGDAIGSLKPSSVSMGLIPACDETGPHCTNELGGRPGSGC